jgi:hypothetical protein
MERSIGCCGTMEGTRTVRAFLERGACRVRRVKTAFELEPLQTAMFIQLVVAGHLLLFSTRAGRFFFEPPFPEWKFFCVIMGDAAGGCPYGR